MSTEVEVAASANPFFYHTHTHTHALPKCSEQGSSVYKLPIFQNNVC